jgi:UDPglucose 6-dehydrogenase
MAKISIIGSGYVGLAIGKGLKKLGNDVIFYDIDENKINQLKNEGLDATLDINYAIQNSDISFITVPTPSLPSGKIDLSYIKKATKAIAKALKNKNSYHLIVVKSTVVPMTTENVVKPILEKFSEKKCGVDFGLCVNPEFLTEIHKSWTDDSSMARDFFTEDRIVIGEFDKKSGDVLEEIYKPLNIPIFRVDLKTAELIKYASNCALASRISYWNEIFLICEKLGIDSNLVAQIVAMDKRIGKYGTVHGKAFGGKCFPKDLKAFIAFAKKIGYKPKLLKAVDEINEIMKQKYGVRE